MEKLLFSTLGLIFGALLTIFGAVLIMKSKEKKSDNIIEKAKKEAEKLGYKVEPRYNDERVDIVQNIEFGKEEDLVKYCQGIQMASPVDSFAIPMPWDMPGYEDKVIMAAGTFTQGSSIELSCDGPIRKPYIAYMQGSLTYEYGKIAIIKAVSNLTK
jgi:cystathionine beta-lyase family protein involved in aluminum resistance